jgi:hypothetical protein
MLTDFVFRDISINESVYKSIVLVSLTK